MPFPVVAAIGAAAQLGAAAIGAGIAKGKDKRQLNQQEKLNNLAIESNKKMMDYQQQKQMEMWENTGYGAQKEQMKGAGINPALMYGMGGGGAQTIGQQSAAIGAADAPKGSGQEYEQMAGLGIQLASQLALMKAQKENIEADTANKLGDAANKPKVGENLEASTASLTQGVENAKAQQKLTEVQTRIANIDEEIKGKTVNDAIDIITNQASKSFDELAILHRNNLLDNETFRTKVDLLKQELANKAIERALMEQQERLTKAQTRTEETKPANIQEDTMLKQQQWKRLIQQGLQDNQRLSIDMQNATTNQRRQETEAWVNDMQESTGMARDILQSIAQGIIFKQILGGKDRQEVKGFRR